MHKLLKRTLFLILFAFVLFFSCRKTEKVFTQPATEAEIKFFTLPASADPSLQKVVDKIRSENEASSFLNEFIKKQGFAVWDKTTVQRLAKSVATKANRTAGDSADLVIIPLVRANEKQVHGALACTIIDDSVTIRLLDGSKYNWYNQHPEITGNNGEQLSLMLMQLDKTVFGHELFKITDPAAFGSKTGKKPRYIKLLPNQGKADNQRWVIETITVTYVTYEDQFDGQVLGCDPGPDCFIYREVTHTIVYQHYVWVNDDYPSPNPDPWYDPNGGGGGTGGGGSGTGETPWVPVGDPIPAIVTVTTVTNNITEPCLNEVYNKITESQYKNKLSTMLQDFQISDQIVISINTNNSLPSNVYGQAYQQQNSEIYNIDLHTSILKKCSQEFIAATYFHEAIHVYLKEHVNEWMDRTSSSHRVMLEDYFNDMAKSVKDIFPNIPLQDAFCMIIDCITNSDQDSNFDQVMLDVIRNTLINLLIRKYPADIHNAGDIQLIADKYRETGTAGTRNLNCN
jgi:hypothetical protein